MLAFPLLAVVAAASLAAQTFPLPATAGDTTPAEDTTPFVLPLRMTQTKVTDRVTLQGQGLPDILAHWDQMAFDASGRQLFVTGEEDVGAGLFRYDTVTQSAVVLLAGNISGIRATDPATWDPANDDYSNLDPCRRTPWNTIVTGEEAEGGRLFEVLNPLSPAGPFSVVWRAKLPAVTFEGLAFDAAGTLYFSDEDNSGSFYKFVPAVPGQLDAGQTFVLCVDAYAALPHAHPERNWDSAVNRGQPRFGPAHWVPMTDAVGNALTVADPFTFGGTVSGGRLAADELVGTPFGRPEDMDIGVLANGHEVLYSALTREGRVASIELVSATTAIVRVFVDFDTTNLATGSDVNPQQNDPYSSPGPGTVFNDPDNIAVDKFGSVYILEDNDPGDIWKAVDADKDGVAEAIGLFASLGVAGAEPSGLIFDPGDPWRCVCNIDAPLSDNSAIWSFNTRPFGGSNQDLDLLTGVNGAATSSPGEFVKTCPGNSLATLRVVSPNGSFDQAGFVLAVELLATTSSVTPLQPPIWLNPALPMAALTSGLLAIDGCTTAVRVPPGLAGFSALVQAFVVAPDLSLYLTDGHEFVLQ